MSRLKVKKIKKDRACFGPVEVKASIDNSYLIEGKLYMKQGGEYRVLPYKLPNKPICDFLNEDKFFIAKLANVSDVTFPIGCPIPIVSLSRQY